MQHKNTTAGFLLFNAPITYQGDPHHYLPKTMPDRFQFDVFLSHNVQDKPRVRRLAERLKAAGVRVWLDEWIIQAGDIIALKVDEGLEQSRVLLLCISPAALASGWVALEQSTAVHRDPSNAGRRFIPLLLGDCELPDTLRRYKYVDFREESEAALRELVDECLRGAPPPTRHDEEAQFAWQQERKPESDAFNYDVFLSYNRADSATVRRLAESLRAGGRRVWFDQWILMPGDDIYRAIEHGLESSRTLVLCVTRAALQSEWVTLERTTELFRDPSNRPRRFIPVLLADCSVPDSLRRYKFVDFREDFNAASEELLKICGPLLMPPIPAPQVIEKPGVRLVYVFSHKDNRFRTQLEPHLSLLFRQGLIAEWHDLELDGRGNRMLPASQMPEADVILFLISADLLASDRFWTEELKQAIERREAGGALLIPIILRPCIWRETPLAKFQALPRSGKPVSSFADRDTAWSDVAEALRRVCRDIMGQFSPFGESPAAIEIETGRAPKTAPRVAKAALFEVFKKSGVPTMTFVEPKDFGLLKLALSQPGRGVVIQGPSGIGKTTALQVAIARVSAPTPVRMLSARQVDDLKHIAKLKHLRKGTVIVDDFHRLDFSLKQHVADYLKHLADTEPRNVKLVVVGIPQTGQTLVEFAPDVATRIDVFSFKKASDESVLQLIEKGEKGLNVTFDKKSQIVIEANGSLNVAQFLCFNICEASGVLETQAASIRVFCEIESAVERVMKTMAAKFGESVRRFAALGGPTDDTCLNLLGQLAINSEEGVVFLNELKDTEVRLGSRITRFLKQRWLQDLCQEYPNAASCLFLDEMTNTLAVDDPQLLFYLRKISYPQLARSAGKAQPLDVELTNGDGASLSVESGHDGNQPPSKITEIDLRYDALVSYRRMEPDKKFARDLVKLLEESGYRIAIDERDFDANGAFIEEMERCIRQSRFVLAVVSPRYFKSGNCVEEAIICKVLDMGERRRRLIPLTIEQVERPVWMYDIVGIDFAATDPLVAPIEKLRQALGRPDCLQQI